MQKLLLENLLTRIFWLFRTDTCGVQWFDGGRGQAVMFWLETAVSAPSCRFKYGCCVLEAF
jgi:hypothetical protein